MPSEPTAGAVVYVRSLADVSQFYAGLLGFDVVESEADHVVLESPSFQLVVLASRSASSVEIASPPVRRTGTPVKLVFVVPSIAASRATAASLGGELNPPEREWRFQQFVVCDGHDPEGNVFQIRQHAG
jgi:predicted enzyme related to lactoylglutathione lyase